MIKHLNFLPSVLPFFLFLIHRSISSCRKSQILEKSVYSAKYYDLTFNILSLQPFYVSLRYPSSHDFPRISSLIESL